MKFDQTPGWLGAAWTRPLLVAAVLSAQTAVIGLAWWVGVHDLVTDVIVNSSDRVHTANEGTAAGVAMAIARSGIETLEPDSPDWERAQSIIEQLKLPGGAIASIVSDDGRVLCHPAIRADGGVSTLAPRKSAMIAAVPLGRLDATVVITDTTTGAASASHGTTSAIAVRTVLSGVVLLSLTGVGAIALISIHSRRLQNQNRMLVRRMTEQSTEVLRTREGMIYGLAKLADYRDSDTGHHLDRICSYATMLAEAMRGSNDEIDNGFIENLRVAASLHDIGKVGVPDRVLLKPGRLTPDERRVVERHAEIGASTLQGIRKRVGEDALLDMSIDIALRHHEKWDGTGYPDGLSGESIPLSARLVAVADVYDALTSDRVYKPAMTHERAGMIIREGRGTHFDPAVIDAFELVADDFDMSRIALRPSECRVAA